MIEIIYLILNSVLMTMAVYYGLKWTKRYVRDFYSYGIMPPFRMLLIAILSFEGAVFLLSKLLGI